MKKLDHYLEEVVLMGRKILKDITNRKICFYFSSAFFCGKCLTQRKETKGGEKI